MWQRFCSILFLLLTLSPSLFAQIDEPELVADEIGAFEDFDGEDSEEWLELLSELTSHPLDFNTASREDLERLPFLSEKQITGILDYRARYGPLHSAGELKLIEALDYTAIRLLMATTTFSVVTPTGGQWNLERLLKSARHELVATARVPTYRRKGDLEGQYLGPPYKHWLRYTLNSGGQRLKAGFVASQDAGEPLLMHGNSWGYDYYSFYVMLQKLGKVKQLIVGRYRFRAGLGLVINGDFKLSKSTLVLSGGRSGSTLNPHSSRMNARYLQGAAITLGLNRQTDLTAFVSWRHIDATLTADSTAIKTLLTTGYHRTSSEMARKNNAGQTAAGAHVGWRSGRFHFGATAVCTAYSLPLQPDTTQRYRKFRATGREFFNASADYGFRSPLITLNGETALDKTGAMATINTLQLNPLSSLSLTAVQRFYSYRYNAPFSQGFSEGGEVHNESGILLSVRWQPLSHWQLTAYTDYAYFPWPKYMADYHTHSWDNMLQATWQRGSWTLSLRHRYRMREYDNSQTGFVSWKREHRSRMRLVFDNSSWQLSTQVDASHVSHTENSFGYMFSEQATLRLGHARLSALVGYFHTDDYQSRFYLIERGLRYHFSFPLCYGHGIRHSLLIQFQPVSRLQLLAKYGTTNYFDRAVIGSGTQQIAHSSQTDIDLQMIWKF